jgi:hypothetical protein
MTEQQLKNDPGGNDAQKIGFKKTDANQPVQSDDQWKKVEDIVTAAKDAYVSGQSDFRNVIETMVSTLQDLLASEQGGPQMGGLGIGAPQMDISEGEAPVGSQPQ